MRETRGRIWEQFMWAYQQPLPWSAAGRKWVASGRIYALSAHPAPGEAV
jgi:L-rhamnose mutarotase